MDNAESKPNMQEGAKKKKKSVPDQFSVVKYSQTNIAGLKN